MPFEWSTITELEEMCERHIERRREQIQAEDDRRIRVVEEQQQAQAEEEWIEQEQLRLHEIQLQLVKRRQEVRDEQKRLRREGADLEDERMKQRAEAVKAFAKFNSWKDAIHKRYHSFDIDLWPHQLNDESITDFISAEEMAAEEEWRKAAKEEMFLRETDTQYLTAEYTRLGAEIELTPTQADTEISTQDSHQTTVTSLREADTQRLSEEDETYNVDLDDVPCTGQEHLSSQYSANSNVSNETIADIDEYQHMLSSAEKPVEEPLEKSVEEPVEKPVYYVWKKPVKVLEEHSSSDEEEVEVEEQEEQPQQEEQILPEDDVSQLFNDFNDAIRQINHNNMRENMIDTLQQSTSKRKAPQKLKKQQPPKKKRKKKVVHVVHKLQLPPSDNKEC